MKLPDKTYDMLIFDVDGTLWDITPILQRSINETLKRHSVSRTVTLQTVISCMGLNGVDYAAKSMPFLSEEIRIVYMKEADTLKNNTIQSQGASAYENAADTIRQLARRKKIAIVSNCGSGYIEVLLEKLGLQDVVTDYMAAYAEGVTKAEAIRRIVLRNGSSSPVYIGDTVMDENACREAGVDFIHAKYGFMPELSSDYAIDRMSDLLLLP